MVEESGKEFGKVSVTMDGRQDITEPRSVTMDGRQDITEPRSCIECSHRQAV
jgi:hypothetical protein